VRRLQQAEREVAPGGVRGGPAPRISGFVMKGLLALLASSLAVQAQQFTEFPPEVYQSGKADVAPVAATAAARGSNSAPVVTGTNASGIGGGYQADEKYKLRIGDKLSFQILEDRDLPKALMVADSGEVDVPYIGRVPAVDKTSRQLSDEIKAQLEKEYYHRATVVVAVDVANRLAGRVYLWGQVRTQGALDMMLNENLTAGRAILRAGGFADFANKKKVKVVRAATDGTGRKQNFELNMVEILEEGRTEKDVVLLPDDFIIVPSRLINF
jgi:protein involved in polysaccharide export with SLBB domain